MAAMIDKHQRALDLGPPRIIIAGGSNIAFNIDSEKVQQELNLPTVNLGLNIGLGIHYILNEIEDIAQEGDIIFLFPTWFTGLTGTYNLQKHTVNHFPKSSKYFRFNLHEELKIHAERTRNHVRNIIVSLIINRSINRAPKVAAPLEGMYSRDNFNEFGDFEGHHDESPPEDLGQRLIYEYKYWEGISVLNGFYNKMMDRGIHMFYFFPAYPKKEFEKNRSALENFRNDLKNDLKIPQIIEPDAFLFSEDLFFDTTFHLNKEGRKLRTEILIEHLHSNADFNALVNELVNKRSIDNNEHKP